MVYVVLYFCLENYLGCKMCLRLFQIDWSCSGFVRLSQVVVNCFDFLLITRSGCILLFLIV